MLEIKLLNRSECLEVNSGWVLSWLLCYIKQHEEMDPAPGAVRANGEVLYDKAPALRSTLSATDPDL